MKNHGKLKNKESLKTDKQSLDLLLLKTLTRIKVTTHVLRIFFKYQFFVIFDQFWSMLTYFVMFCQIHFCRSFSLQFQRRVVPIGRRKAIVCDSLVTKLVT